MRSHLLPRGLVLALAVASVALPLRAEDANATYKLGKGFTWQTDDGRFKINIGGRIQARYTYEGYDSDRDKDDLSEFTAERVRVKLSGHIFDDFEFEFQSDWGKGDERLKDAMLDWTKHDAAQVKVGQFKIHFDESEWISSGSLQFVDRSLAAKSLGYSRDVGIQLHGEVADKKFLYGVGAYNGEGENGRNKNDGNMYAVHFSFQPAGDFGKSEGNLDRSKEAKWLISLSGLWNENLMGDIDGDGKANDLTDEARYVAGFGFRQDRIYLRGEYYWRMQDVDGKSNSAVFMSNGTDSIDSDAWYFQLGVMLADNDWEMAIRYAEYDPDNDISNDKKAEATLAVSRYLWDVGHSLKIQGDLSWLDEEDGPGSSLEDWRVRLQAQIVF